VLRSMDVSFKDVGAAVEGIFNVVKDKIDQTRGSELERKVKEATSSENWAASRTIKDEIAKATYDYSGYKEVMETLWKRMAEPSKNWQTIFKSLDLLEFLLKNGSDRVISEARDRQYQIRTLKDFHVTDASGKERGNGIREKSRQLCDLLNDDSSLQEEREKAAKLRDKWTSVSSQDTSRGRHGSGGFGSSAKGYDYPAVSEFRSDRKESAEKGEFKSPVKEKKSKKGTKKSKKKGSDSEEVSDVGTPTPVSTEKTKKKKKKATESSEEDAPAEVSGGETEEEKSKPKSKKKEKKPKSKVSKGDLALEPPPFDAAFEAAFKESQPSASAPAVPQYAPVATAAAPDLTDLFSSSLDFSAPLSQASAPVHDSGWGGFVSAATPVDFGFSGRPVTSPTQTQISSPGTFGAFTAAPPAAPVDPIFGQFAAAPSASSKPDDALFGDFVSASAKKTSVAPTSKSATSSKPVAEGKSSDPWASLVDLSSLSSKKETNPSLPDLGTSSSRPIGMASMPSTAPGGWYGMPSAPGGMPGAPGSMPGGMPGAPGSGYPQYPGWYPGYPQYPPGSYGGPGRGY